MNLKVLFFIFFIKILNIIPNTLYIDEGILLEDNVINYNWLKSAIRRNTTLVISEVELIKNPSEGIYLDNKVIQDPKDPDGKTKKITIIKTFKTTKIYKSCKDLVKIEINDTSKIDEIINNVKTELNNKTYTNIEKISTIITKYESEETKEVSYEYDIIDINNKLFSILHSDYNENNVNNPSVIGIMYNKNFLIKNFFFSYFQVEDNFGIFEDSKINHCILENLKKTNLKSNNLFKNCKNLKMINLGVGYTDGINIIENQNMLLNCENLDSFYLNNCDNQKISFENLKKLFCLNIGKIREIDKNLISYNNTSILDEKKFYNCEMLCFNSDDLNLVINKDTTGLDNVFYNCGKKNSNNKKKVKITIEEDTVLDEINLDKMFNNSYFTDIEIINKSSKKITGSVKLFENKNLNYINIKDSSIDNSGKSFERDLLEYKTFEGKYYRDIEGLKFEDFLKDQKTFSSKLRKQICDDEEKKGEENEKNKKHSVKDINNINNNTCCTKCLSCCYNCKCC